jgi:hypothetical protein
MRWCRRKRKSALCDHIQCVCNKRQQPQGWLALVVPLWPTTVNADSEGLISAGVYFFHVNSGPNLEPCPIVPNFRAWIFPHDDLPSLWHESAHSAVAIEPRTATETCRLTKKRLACENAHIIPSAEKSCFADNEMDRYGELGGRTGQDVADSPANSIRLRRDVHLLWDSLFFSIVPKESQNGETAETRWCVHGMVQDEELHADYHNRPTESLTSRSVEYLYARFAWDIFPKVIGFLQSTQPRRLAVRQADGEVEVRIFSTQECKDFTRNQGRGRSASPTKRSRGPDGKAYERTDSAGQKCDVTTKRKRRRISHGQSVSNDSAVSDVDSSSDLSNAPTSPATGLENHWNVKGWMIQQSSDDPCGGDSDREQPRGRKKCRDLR